MKRIIHSLLLVGLTMAWRAGAEEATRISLTAAPLTNPAVVLSGASFNAGAPARPIVYYTAFGGEVLLPSAGWVFSAANPRRDFRIGVASCSIEHRDGGFTLSVGSRRVPLAAEGLGCRAAPIAENGPYLLAFPRASSYRGENRLFCRSGTVQTGTVDGAEIRLYDDDMDGLYAKGQDGVSVGDRGGLGVFGALGGRLPTPQAAYEVRDVAPDGSTVTLARYGGPTGRLTMAAISNIETRLVFAAEDGKCAFGTLAGDQPLVLPAGRYRFLYGLLYRPSARRVAGIVLPSPDLPVTIEKDADTLMTLGNLARRELPWGEGVAYLDFRRLLAVDLSQPEAACDAGDFAKAQEQFDKILKTFGSGPNYEASRAGIEALRLNLALENSPGGAALRSAESKALAALREGKRAEAKAAAAEARTALAALPAAVADSWPHLAHRTRCAVLARGAEGAAIPGLRLKANEKQKNAATETADTIDWTDPQGKGWGHTRLYEGELLVPKAGTYELALESVGTANVVLDGTKVIDHPYHLPAERAVTLELTEGAHPIAVDVKCYVYGYTHANKPHMVRLRWTPPGGRKTIVPAWAFQFPEPSAGTTAAQK